MKETITQFNENPLKLPALEQAHYIAGLLQSGPTEREIVRQFSGDAQLVKMWLDFLAHNEWARPIFKDQNKQIWVTTDKGKDWLDAMSARWRGD